MPETLVHINKRLYGYESDFAAAKTPVLAGTFGELVRLAAPVVMHFVGDLWHDAIWLDKHVVHGAFAFYYGIREYGTSIGTDRSLVAMNNERLFIVQILEDRGEWSVEIMEVAI